MDYSSLKIEGKWKMLWEVQVPRHVRMFFWRVCKDCLPTRCRLQSRWVSCPLTRVHCSREVENSRHVLLACTEVKEIWMEAGLWVRIANLLSSAESIPELIFSLCDNLSVEERSI